MIVAMILFPIAVGIAVWYITVSSITNEPIWLLFLTFSLLCVMGGTIILESIPTTKDVRKGEAHYIEQNHVEVVNGDTINNYKTYEILWIENSK